MLRILTFLTPFFIVYSLYLLTAYKPNRTTFKIQVNPLDACGDDLYVVYSF